MLSVTHVSTLHAPLLSSSGFRHQLQSEWNAAEELRLNDVVDWQTVLLVPEHRSEDNYAGFGPEVIKAPRMLSGRLGLRLFKWLVVRQRARKSGIVLVRHAVIDPLQPIMIRLTPNLAVVHHTNGVSELALGGHVLASKMERILVGLSPCRNTATVGVTPELWHYATRQLPVEGTPFTYPNGIYVDNVSVLDDSRNDDQVEVLFVASKFSKWHGLEKLIASLKTMALSDKLIIHLVGRLSDDQVELLSNTSLVDVTIEAHGYLNDREIASIAGGCSVGIGSLDLASKNMNEACTLKVREYLASGLPVYATHRDSGLPQDFPYFFQDEAVDPNKLIDFAKEMKRVSRSTVRDEAGPYISKTSIMRALIEQFERNGFISG